MRKRMNICFYCNNSWYVQSDKLDIFVALAVKTVNVCMKILEASMQNTRAQWLPRKGEIPSKSFMRDNKTRENANMQDFV